MKEISNAMMEFQRIGRDRMAVAGFQSLPNPSGPVYVAQPTRRLFQIGLELKDRVAELLIPRCLHGRQGVEKTDAVPPDQPAQNFAFELVRDFRIAEEKPRIEERGIRFHLAFIEVVEICYVSNLVTDLELQVPQRVQDGLDRVLVDSVFEEEQEVDVRPRMQRRSSVTSNRQ